MSDDLVGRRIYPNDATSEMLEVLGMKPWELQPIAKMLRASGQQIKTRFEDEQSAALHWLLKLAIDCGPAWRVNAGVEIARMAEAAGRPFKP